MSFGSAKVYFDGSHYIAIPPTTRRKRKRKKTVEEKIIVLEKGPEQMDISDLFSSNEGQRVGAEVKHEQTLEQIIKADRKAKEPLKTARVLTKKQLFNEFYTKSRAMDRTERYNYLLENLREYFQSAEETKWFVLAQLRRQYKNTNSRRVRFFRKANLNKFNYFATFTYDDKLHTEDEFRKRLIKNLQNYHTRKGWTYIGVWERSNSDRLHFHCLLNIPDNTMPGELIEVKDYNTVDKKMRVTLQNTYFNDKFGRTDFELMPTDKLEKGRTIKYLIKYMEKTGEKIVYSRGLAMYIISDIMDEDIVCPIGAEDKKVLLYDDFTCWEEGTKMGKVSDQVIQQMRKTN